MWNSCVPQDIRKNNVIKLKYIESGGEKSPLRVSSPRNQGSLKCT